MYKYNSYNYLFCFFNTLILDLSEITTAVVVLAAMMARPEWPCRNGRSESDRQRLVHSVGTGHRARLPPGLGPGRPILEFTRAWGMPLLSWYRHCRL